MKVTIENPVLNLYTRKEMLDVNFEFKLILNRITIASNVTDLKQSFSHLVGTKFFDIKFDFNFLTVTQKLTGNTIITVNF